ncbi:MAG TPA: hypothetical protein VFV78_00540, partial [Vicinamibacterales bacterium]|nr:hypothetical protein [Vicinamibacterales bacterium]
MHRLVFAPERIFDGAEALGELVVGLTKGRLRIEAEFARKVGDREQKIAELFGGAGMALVQGLSQLARLLIDLVHHVFRLGPLEADGGDAGANLVGPRKRGQ